MWAELHPELLFYILEEGALGALHFSVTGQEKKRRGREVRGLQLSATCVAGPVIVEELPDVPHLVKAGENAFNLQHKCLTYI